MREAGVQVNDELKIHAKHPTINDHSLYFTSSNVRIVLSLLGIFSYFPFRTPTHVDLDESPVLVLTSDGPQWNPHSYSYTRNEENMLDWEGNMVEPKD